MPFDPFKAIEVSLGINRTATRIAVGGFIVLALAVSLKQVVGDTSLTLWQMLAALVALVIFMMVIQHLPLLARRTFAWVVAACFAAWMVAITILNIYPIRSLPPPHCVASFHMAEGCSASVAAASVDVSAEATLSATAEPAVAPPAAEALAASRVFIQFAGFPRDSIVGLADTLAANGWQVEGRERGGQRIGAAAGLNEVRYFNAEDKALAEELARNVAAGLPEPRTIEVKNLSGGRFGDVPAGQLEVWVSQ